MEDAFRQTAGTHFEGSPMPLKLLPLVAAETGYTEKALRRKIEQGVLVEGREYFRQPDGKIGFDMEKFEQWQRNETPSGSAH